MFSIVVKSTFVENIVTRLNSEVFSNFIDDNIVKVDFGSDKDCVWAIVLIKGNKRDKDDEKIKR